MSSAHSITTSFYAASTDHLDGQAPIRPANNAPSAVSLASASLRARKSSLIVLRTLSILSAIGFVSTTFAHIYQVCANPETTLFLGILLPFGALPLAWDLADATISLVRCGDAIPAKSHIGCELVILLGGVGGTAMFIQQLRERGASDDELQYVYATGAFGAFLVLARLVFFVNACIDRAQELKHGRPRVMLIPSTGNIVYLIPQLAAKATLTGIGVLAQDQDNEALRHAHDAGTKSVHGMQALSRAEDLLIPPPADYVPDEAEEERRQRGESQPQLISQQNQATKFARDVY